MLEQIVKTKRVEISNYPRAFQEKTFTNHSLKRAMINSNRKVGLIAEVKKASPSKGIIRKDFHPVEIAKAYENTHADAISVLTDQTYFQGHPDYLTQIKQVVDLPVLRKDFIIDPVQIEESKSIGADAILLIQAILDPKQAKELFLHAKQLGLEVLLEVHSKAEVEMALTEFTPDLLGINNRDLNTFKTSVAHTSEIAAFIPEGIPFISESGIKTSEDVNQVHAAGASGILVGETLMKADSITQCIKSLFEENE
ncbi:indole-3-glycerol phosphate synthase TrpC [Pseudalkalibacillus salsuginis]|uniref:indole-3-glycerol phosphate synthase TrpC n=1 Tax=Pseudalkalibacillus salsuginis TaxID=2910972 RepID=UPI001F187E5F|nr:indole-3-glycerol phosphate synthase TrpC [Pseudalkalibacillus salsuginis]MCF6411718.1 indole-3-glycerol phosphate synthase TrpC [Pseudalkalibacillus salsuginis]